MNKATLTKLLNKESWTGAELGKLEIAIMADLYDQNSRGVQNPTPFVPIEQLRKMVKTINNPADGRTFNGYDSIYQWLCVVNPYSVSMEQQFNVRYRTLVNYLELSIQAEEAYKYIEELPEVMTQAQYNKTVETGIHKFCYYPDGSPVTEELLLFILFGIKQYAAQLEKDPTADNPLKEIKEKYSKEFVKSSYILNNYNRANGNGYYTLPDGRRSDKMDKEEWRRTVNPALYEALEFLEENGEMSEERKKLLTFRLARRNQFIYDGLGEAAADALDQSDDITEGRRVPTEWHYYEEPPEDITKWEILSDSENLAAYYPNLAAFPKKIFKEEDREEFKEAFIKAVEEWEDFTEEFKEAVETIEADIDKKYYKYINFPEEVQKPLIDSITALEPEDYFICSLNRADLLEADAYGFKNVVYDRGVLFADNPKAVRNGVAVLSNSNAESYTAPKFNNPFKTNTLEGFFTDDEDYAFNVDMVDTAKREIIRAYYYLKAYNTIIDEIADYYAVPDILLFKNQNMDNLEAKLNAYNTLVPMLYVNILETEYTDKDFQRKKLEALKDNFPQIHYELMKIKPEAIEEVKAAFKNFEAFDKDKQKNSGVTDWITNTVFNIPPDYSF